MKFRLITFTLMASAILNSCDAPRTARTSGKRAIASSDYWSPSSTGNNTNNNSGSNSSGDDNGSTTGNDGSNSTIPSEISHCKWSMDGNTNFSSSHKHVSPNEDDVSVGGYTLCKSKNDETQIYIQLQSVLDVQVCLFPTYNSGSNSVYLGEARCLRIDDSKKIYRVNMLKNRPGFTAYPITGVMLMKDKLFGYDAPFNRYLLAPDAYTFCSNWLAQYGDPSFCESFKRAGQYVYQTL